MAIRGKLRQYDRLWLKCIHWLLDIIWERFVFRKQRLARIISNEQHRWVAGYRVNSAGYWNAVKLVLERLELYRKPNFPRLFCRLVPGRCNRLGLDSLCENGDRSKFCVLWRLRLQLIYFAAISLHEITVNQLADIFGLPVNLGILSDRVFLWCSKHYMRPQLDHLILLEHHR